MVNLLVKVLAVLIAAYLLPGVGLNSYFAALVLVVVLGLINTFIKPLLILLTLPINILSLGLFTFVLNAIIILAASRLVEGFMVQGFWWALAFGLVLSLITTALFSLTRS